MLDNALPSFVHPAAHLYAPPLIHTLHRSFIQSTTHSYTLPCIRMLPFASAFILTPHHRFMFVCIFARSCPLQLTHVRVHVRMLCSHMHPWALHSHPGPSICLKELLWSVTTQGRHYKQTSPWVSLQDRQELTHPHRNEMQHTRR